LYEMVSAYATFANGGKKPEITGILKVENANGDVLEEWRQKEFDEVLDPQIAFLINDILSDQAASVGPGLFVNGKVNAAKTGTSTKENKKASGGSSVLPSDTWTIGYSPTIVTGVWAGNADGAGLKYNANGYDTAAPIFKAVMTKALEGQAAEPFPEPDGIKRVKVSKASGKLPGSETPAGMIVTEIFPSFAVPDEVERLFFTVKIDKVSGLLATEFTPEDAIEEVTYQNYIPIANMLNWANEIKEYYKEHSEKEDQSGSVRIGLPPTEYDNIHTADSSAKAPNISIVGPSSNSKLGQGHFEVELELSVPNGVETVEFYMDEKLEYSTSVAPYTGHLNVSRFMADGSRHLIVAKVVDKLGYSSQSAIEIKVDMDGGDDDDNDNKVNDEVVDDDASVILDGETI